MSDERKFDEWALVELFGHSRIAGRVTEASIGGCSFIRVDVPGEDNNWLLTRYLGQGAIYALNPTTEKVAREMARQINYEPPYRYELKALDHLRSADNDDENDIPI